MPPRKMRSRCSPSNVAVNHATKSATDAIIFADVRNVQPLEAIHSARLGPSQALEPFGRGLLYQLDRQSPSAPRVVEGDRILKATASCLLNPHASSSASKARSRLPFSR